MSKSGQKASLVDVSSTGVPGIPLNLQSAPKHTSTAGKSSRRAAQTSTTSCDDDVFGLRSLSSRGSSVSAVSTPAATATAVATLVQIGEGSSDDSSVFTDWDRLRSEAAAIAGGIAAGGGATPNRLPDLDAFSPLVGDSPLLFSEEAKEPPDNLLVSSPDGSPLKPLRLKDEMDANSASGGASAVADLGGAFNCIFVASG